MADDQPAEGTKQEPATVWVEAPPAPEPVTNSRSEADASKDDTGQRGHPTAHLLAGGIGLTFLTAIIVFQQVGLLAAVATAAVPAGGTAAYGVYRARRNRPQRRTSRTRSRTSRTRTGSTGRGKGLGLGGGRRSGAKMGGAGRGKGLGLGSRGKGTGTGARGKGPLGKLLGGRGRSAGKSGAGTRGKLFSGGRGGAKTGAGARGGKFLGRGRTGTGSRRAGGRGTGSRTRSGSVSAGRRGSGLPLLGKRGVGVAARRGKAGFGRWGNSTGAGARHLSGSTGRGAKRAGRKLGGAALRTKTGRRAATAAQAARLAMGSSSGKGRFARMNAARQAAGNAYGGGDNWFSRWGTDLAAALIVLMEMGRQRRQRHQAKRAGATAPGGAKQSAAGGWTSWTWSGPKYWAGPPMSGATFTRGSKSWAQGPRVYVHRVFTGGPASSGAPGSASAGATPKGNAPAGGPKVIRGSLVGSTTYHPHSPGREIVPFTNWTPAPAPNTSTITRSRSAMPRVSEFPIAAAVEGCVNVAGNYRPGDSWQIEHDFTQMWRLPAAVASMIQAYTTTIQSGNYALEPEVAQLLMKAHEQLGDAVATMHQMDAAFQAIHAGDIRRRTNPRGNESSWNQ